MSKLKRREKEGKRKREEEKEKVKLEEKNLKEYDLRNHWREDPTYLKVVLRLYETWAFDLNETSQALEAVKMCLHCNEEALTRDVNFDLTCCILSTKKQAFIALASIWDALK